MWSKKNRLLIAAGAVALLVLGTVLSATLLLPFLDAKNTMDPGGVLTIRTLEDGSLQLQWPEGTNATGYEVLVRDNDGAVLHSARTDGCTAVIPELPAEGAQLCISSLRDYDGKTRKGSEDLVVSLSQPAPRICDPEFSVDTQFDTVDVSFDMSGSDRCSVYIADASGAIVPVQQVQTGSCRLHFGVDDPFPVPEYGQQLQVLFRPERTDGNVVYEGALTEGFVLTREDFLGRDLQVEQSYNGNNSYTFTWNETKGEYYDVRLSEDGGSTWMTIAYIPADRDRSFTTPCLKAYTDYCVSVVAVGGQTMEGSEFAAVAETLRLATTEKLLYSTIWPLMDQKVYADTEAAQELGTAPAASAWCVLGQEGKWLKIRFQGQDAYIDGDYCMINLPEYIGNLCAYDITNSYDSIYMVHEYGIENVSGTVITGYEAVQVTEGEYLVPLLYPVARKLLKAGLDAKSRGYTLKIYDSFRPQDATDSIYWKTNSILGRMIPDKTYSGKKVTDLYLVNWGPAEGETAEPGADYGGLSYRRLMTNNGAYSLSSFLASGTSRHNFGVALDLTLVDPEGTELPMQTSMHDLSWYSASARNNANAELLRQIMNGAGFGGIGSEWWHYQDNEIQQKNRYAPLRTGVSFECWVADNNGWRYRLKDGSFLANGTQEIEGESYRFDENGYLVK